MSKFHLSSDDKTSQLSPQDWFNLTTFEAALEHLRSEPTLNLDQKRLWSTPDPELIKLFHAIYLDDMQQVQTCLEPNIKCHPLCDCDDCASGDKILMMKDNLRC